MNLDLEKAVIGQTRTNQCAHLIDMLPSALSDSSLMEAPLEKTEVGVSAEK